LNLDAFTIAFAGLQHDQTHPNPSWRGELLQYGVALA
jgi:hypothetical protein